MLGPHDAIDDVIDVERQQVACRRLRAVTEHFDRFIEAGIKSGRFTNASEVVREGLRLLEEREQTEKAKLDWLRAAAKEGFDQIDRGEGIEFASIDDLEAHIRQIGQEMSEDVAAGRRRD